MLGAAYQSCNSTQPKILPPKRKSPELVPGIAIVFSVDKFMSEVRALTNITGNGIATVFVSWWEGELDRDKLHSNLNQTVDPSDLETAVTTG